MSLNTLFRDIQYKEWYLYSYDAVSGRGLERFAVTSMENTNFLNSSGLHKEQHDCPKQVESRLNQNVSVIMANSNIYNAKPRMILQVILTLWNFKTSKKSPLRLSSSPKWLTIFWYLYLTWLIWESYLINFTFQSYDPVHSLTWFAWIFHRKCQGRFRLRGTDRL